MVAKNINEILLKFFAMAELPKNVVAMTCEIHKNVGAMAPYLTTHLKVSRQRKNHQH
jgi:hypothetical protein